MRIELEGVTDLVSLSAAFTAAASLFEQPGITSNLQRYDADVSEREMLVLAQWSSDRSRMVVEIQEGSGVETGSGG